MAKATKVAKTPAETLVKQVMEYADKFEENISQYIPAGVIEKIRNEDETISSVYYCPKCRKEFTVESSGYYYGYSDVVCPECGTYFTRTSIFGNEVEPVTYSSSIIIQTEEVPESYVMASIESTIKINKDFEIEDVTHYITAIAEFIDNRKVAYKGVTDVDGVTTFTSTTTKLQNLMSNYYRRYGNLILINMPKEFSDSKLYSFYSSLDKKVSDASSTKKKELVIPSEIYEDPIVPEITEFVGIVTKVQSTDLISKIDTVKCKCLICGKEWLTEREQFNRGVLECPYCGTAEFIDSDSFPWRNTICYITDSPDKVSLKLFNVQYKEDFDAPKMNSSLDAYIEFYPKKSPICFRKKYSTEWRQSKFDGRSMDYRIDKVVILSDCDLLKYSGLSEFVASNPKSYINIAHFIRDALKYNVVEKIAKLGMTDEYLRKYNDYAPIKVDLTASTVQDAFSISKPLLKYYRKAKESFGTEISLRRMQDLYAADETIKGEEILWSCRYDVPLELFQAVQRVIPTMTIAKAVSYLERVRLGQMFQPRPAISEWRDYLDACKSLMMDMRDNKVLYPRALKTEHDIVVAKQHFIKDESVREDFMKSVEEYKELEYHRDDWFIKVPESLESMFEEGRKLNHCCGRYVDDVARKQALVLFLRRKDNPDEPFLSIEVTPDKIVRQVRGMNDSYIYVLDDYREISAFLTYWAKMKHLTLDIK